MLGWSQSAFYSLLAGVALKSTAALGVALLSAWLLRGRSAAVRHLVWSAAAVAVLTLPFLAVSLPALRVPVGSSLGAVSPALFQVAALGRSEKQPATSVTRAAGGVNPTQPAPERPDWLFGLTLLWLAGAGVALTRMGIGWRAMLRLRRSARPFADGGLTRELAEGLGIRRRVEVLETGAGSMPVTFGIVRSAILLPANAAVWSEERRRSVLLHELAHVRRGDSAMHILARAALSLYWWNPLAWVAWREFLKDSERAADDLVLNAGARASEYAAHLLEVARAMQSGASVAWGGVAMARRSHLEGRLRAILDARVRRNTPGPAAALMAAALAAGIVAPLAAVRAQEKQEQPVPADVAAAIRGAQSQNDFAQLDKAAQAAERLGEYELARKLLDAAVAIRAAIHGQQSPEYGLGLLKLADLEQQSQNLAGAEDLYSKAAQILGDRPEGARALLRLGTAALSKGNFAQARDDFEQAQHLDPDRASLAAMWLALTREKEKLPDAADALFRSAVSLQNPKSPDAATVLMVYARFLRDQGRPVAAAEMDDRAAALRQANAQPRPEPSKGAYRIGGSAGATPPKVLGKIEPRYTEEARIAKLQGTVVVSVEIGPDGLAHNAQVLRGLGLGLDENAIEAISQWRFQPGARDGQPVTVAATIEVNYRLL